MVSGNPQFQKGLLQVNSRGGENSPPWSGCRATGFLPGELPSRWLVKWGGSRGGGTHLIGVGPILVLGPVAGIAEGFAAALVLTHVRLLTRV